MLNELFDKTKILRKVQVEKLTEANENLLNYLQSETIALAEKSITEDSMSVLGVVRETGE